MLLLPLSANIDVALYLDNGGLYDALSTGPDRTMYYIKHGYAFLSDLPDTKKKVIFFI